VQITFIEADPSGPDIESEYVRIENKTGSNVNMTDWTLEKNTSKVFEFPSYTLRSGRKVDVYSRSENEDDDDDDSVLYWGLSGAIWDNLRDCAYLYDDDNDLVDEYCYDRPR
jgi:ATP-dependent phosphoenolpyruvate carboxykinase